VIFGTRPEAIKLCPLVHALRTKPNLDVVVCVTGQHREMLDQVLAAFEVRPDIDLEVMQPGQTLTSLTARILAELEPVFQRERPSLAIVQGDTTTTLAGALAAFYHHVPVAHVEAGLRTGDLDRPFPEEMNRVLTSRLAAIHFAPTERSRANLLAEGVPEAAIHVTGNTGIDAILATAARLESGQLPASAPPRTARHRIVVTSHRRENFGDGFDSAMKALVRLAARPDLEILYPVHRNPQASEPAFRYLSGLPNVHLLDPQPYTAFVDLLRSADLVITDSGGIQEEAPSLGKPVLVMRDTTERPEAVEAGTAILVGTNEDRIVAEATRLLDDRSAYLVMTRTHNPYGDGKACGRIVSILELWLASGGSAARP
jgi:UDP-N-acetylglucosamine 2-epimerase (non-hydrolysing)